MKARFLLTFFIFFLFNIAHANLLIDELYPSKETYKKRLDCNFSYAYRNPKKEYGPIEEGYILYNNQLNPDITIQIFGAGYRRDEGNGILGAVNLFLDWLPCFYTFTSVSKGSNTDYLPKIRLDQDFLFKLGSQKQYVPVFGVSLMKFFDTHRLLVLSPGINYYCNDWLFCYRLYINKSDPGNMWAASHKLAVTYSNPGYQEITWDVNFGKQSYLTIFNAEAVFDAEAVNQKSFSTNLFYRQWLGKCWGILADLGFAYIEAPCRSYRSSLGLFKEF